MKNYSLVATLEAETKNYFRYRTDDEQAIYLRKADIGTGAAPKKVKVTFEAVEK
jgi:hypothetical protein